MTEKNPATETLGKEILPFEMGYLPDFFQKKAAAELNESPDTIIEKMNELKHFLTEDKLTNGYIYVDEFLMMFLRVKTYNSDKAFRQIKSCIRLRKKNPTMFSDITFDSVVQTLEKEIMYVLPWRCQDGCFIFVIQIENWDPDSFSVEEIKRAVVTYLLSSLRDPMSQVNGVKVVFDVKAISKKYLRHATPKNLHLIYHAAQHACPIRYKEVHIINDSHVFRTAYAIVKPFLSEKIKSRMVFHKNYTTLLNYFPRSILPKPLGGDLENYHMTDWLKRSMTPEKLVILAGIRNWPSK